MVQALSLLLSLLQLHLRPLSILPIAICLLKSHRVLVSLLQRVTFSSGVKVPLSTTLIFGQTHV